VKIKIAEHTGFCFGVKRAVQTAEETALKSKEPVITLGPLIHNQEEVERLRKLGIKELAEGELQGYGSILIRAHGIGPNLYRDLQEKGYKIIDTTCPHVRKAQTLANEAQKQGYQVIVLGDKNHAEVQGIQAWTENNAIIVSSLEELQEIELSLYNKVAILAQTTEKEEKFAAAVKYLHGKVLDLKVLPTICTATRIRQEAAAKLAQEVDLMIVIGGKNSSNTQKLAEICQNYNIPVYCLEKATELQPSWFQKQLTVGVTAGASTPDWIIKEVIEKMEEINEGLMKETNEEQMEEVNEERQEFQEEYNIKNFQPGDMVEGTIVQINNDEVLVDIGGKSEGIVPLTELPNDKVNPKEYLQIGEKILVEVLKEDREGNILLSCKEAYFNEAMDKLAKAKETGEIIEAPVIEVIKGGLLVDVGIKGFVPASQVERTFVEDFQNYLQKKLRLKVIEFEPEKKKIVLSQRIVLEEEYAKKRNALWEQLAEGETRKGIVKKVMKFGVFVDIGGIDGLLHVSELGWGKVNHPSEVLQEGDEVEVYVLKVDYDNQKVSLSLKKLLADPWQEALNNYQVNSIVKGIVARIMPFGAFVELEPGLEGLLHISKISEKRINKVEEILKEGQKVDVKIVEIDADKKRISLSIKDITTDKEKKEYQTYIEQQPNEASITIRDTIGDTMGNTLENLIKKKKAKSTDSKQNSKEDSKESSKQSSKQSKK